MPLTLERPKTKTAAKPTKRTQRKHRERTALLIMLGVVLFAFALRLYRLNHYALSTDETLTGLRIVNFHDERTDYAPDFLPRHMVYVSTVGLMYRFVPSDFGLRWQAVLAGAVAAAMAYRAISLWVNRRAGMLSAVLLTLLPISLFYGQYVKQYSVLIMLAMTSLWCLHALDQQDAKWARWAYPLVAVATASIHAMSSLWIGAQSIYLLLRNLSHPREARWGAWLGAQVGVAASVGVTFFFERVTDSPLLPAFVPPVAEDVMAFFKQALGLAEFREITFDLVPLWLSIALILTMLGVFLVQMWRTNREQLPFVGLLLGSVLLPPTIIVILSYVWTPTWVLRYVLLAAITMPVLLGVVIAQVRPRVLAYAVGGLLLVSMLTLNARYYYQPYVARNEQFGRPYTYLRDNHQPGDILAADSIATQTFYLRDTGLVLSPDAVNAQRETPEDDPLLQTIVENERVWVLWNKAWRPYPAEWFTEYPDIQPTERIDFGWAVLDLYDQSAERTSDSP